MLICLEKTINNKFNRIKTITCIYVVVLSEQGKNLTLLQELKENE